MFLPALRVAVFSTIAVSIPCATLAVEPILLPDLVGTVRSWPDVDVPRIAQSQTAQAIYDRSTPENRQFRRGFVEFVLPSAASPGVQRAALVFGAPTDPSNQDLPLNRYRVGFYPNADLNMEPEDYDLELQPVGEFSQDPNDGPYRAEIDVTSILREHRGEIVGFSIRVAEDPDLGTYEHRGTGWGGRDTVYPAHIEIEFEEPAAVLPVVTGTVGRISGDRLRALANWLWTDTVQQWNPAEDDRALVEFELPHIQGRVESARLLVPLAVGARRPPRAGEHRLLWYDDVDGRIDTGDYTRQAENLGRLDLDPSAAEPRFAVDITHLVRTHRGRPLGFRIERLDGMGTTFGERLYSGRSPWIEIETGPPRSLAAGAVVRVRTNLLAISADASGRQQIKYEVPSPSEVRIEVFDVRGRLVETLVRRNQPSGSHIVSWDARSRANGMYFYRLMIDNEVTNRRSVVLR